MFGTKFGTDFGNAGTAGLSLPAVAVYRFPVPSPSYSTAPADPATALAAVEAEVARVFGRVREAMVLLRRISTGTGGRLEDVGPAAARLGISADAIVRAQEVVQWLARLDPRSRAIVTGAATGKSRGAIARGLGCSTMTVWRHEAAAYRAILEAAQAR